MASESRHELVAGRMASTFVKVAGHLFRLFRPKPMAERVDMSGRRVIVTGASPGSIGYETARTLADWGADVVATSLRNVESLERALLDNAGGSDRDARGNGREAGGNDHNAGGRDPNTGGNGRDRGNITVRRLDLCDADSVADFAAWYTHAHGGRLHVLINNAGVHKGVFTRKTASPPSPDGFEIHWRTNYLGPFHLTSLLLPALRRGARESGDARVLNLVSHLHETVTNESLFAPPRRYDAWDAYGRSKLALVHFTFELQRRLGATHNLQACAVDPGSVSTNLTRLEIPEDSLAAPLRRIIPRLDAPILLRPEHGAQTSILCASRKALQGGRYFERCGVGKAGAQATEKEVAARLWKQAEQWVSTL